MYFLKNSQINRSQFLRVDSQNVAKMRQMDTPDWISVLQTLFTQS